MYIVVRAWTYASWPPISAWNAPEYVIFIIAFTCCNSRTDLVAATVCCQQTTFPDSRRQLTDSRRQLINGPEGACAATGEGLLFEIRVPSSLNSMFICCFTSYQHLRTDTAPVTTRTHCDIIVLPHWDTRTPTHLATPYGLSTITS